jgi:hypothetical protein
MPSAPPDTATGSAPTWSSSGVPGRARCSSTRSPAPTCPGWTRPWQAEAVLHAASQDLPCLAEIGFRPRQLFDTELAGRLLGYPRVALGTWSRRCSGFHLEKGHSAADWSVRPLREELLRYAALDVEVLIELRDALGRTRRPGQDGMGPAGVRGRARGQARRGPARPVAAHLGHPPGAVPPRARRRPRALDDQGQIAQAADLSPRRVLPDTAIIEAARSLPRQPRAADQGSADSPAARPGGTRRTGWPRSRGRGPAPTASLPDAVGGAIPNGPPPAHRWAERDPAAAARLAAARAASDGHRRSTAGCRWRTCSPRTPCAGSAGIPRSQPTPERLAVAPSPRTEPGPGRSSSPRGPSPSPALELRGGGGTETRRRLSMGLLASASTHLGGQGPRRCRASSTPWQAPSIITATGRSPCCCCLRTSASR